MRWLRLFNTAITVEFQFIDAHFPVKAGSPSHINAIGIIKAVIHDVPLVFTRQLNGGMMACCKKYPA